MGTVIVSIIGIQTLLTFLVFYVVDCLVLRYI